MLTIDEALEARTTAAARVGHHLGRAAQIALNEFGIGVPYDNELAQAAIWRVRWEAAHVAYLRLWNAQQDDIEVRNARG